MSEGGAGVVTTAGPGDVPEQPCRSVDRFEIAVDVRREPNDPEHVQRPHVDRRVRRTEIRGLAAVAGRIVPEQTAHPLEGLVDELVDRHAAIPQAGLVELSDGRRDPHVDRRRRRHRARRGGDERIHVVDVEQRRPAVRTQGPRDPTSADVRVQTRRRHAQTSGCLRRPQVGGHGFIVTGCRRVVNVDPSTSIAPADRTGRPGRPAGKTGAGAADVLVSS